MCLPEKHVVRFGGSKPSTETASKSQNPNQRIEPSKESQKEANTSPSVTLPGLMAARALVPLRRPIKALSMFLFFNISRCFMRG